MNSNFEYDPSDLFGNEPFMFADLVDNLPPAIELQSEEAALPLPTAASTTGHSALVALWEKAEGLRRNFEAAQGTVDPRNYQWTTAELACLMAWFNSAHRTQEECLRVASFFNPLCTIRELVSWIIQHELGSGSAWWKPASTPLKVRFENLRGPLRRHLNQETGPLTSRTERDNMKRAHAVRKTPNAKQRYYEEVTDLTKYQGHSADIRKGKGPEPRLIQLTPAGFLAIRELFGIVDAATVLSELAPKTAGLNHSFLLAFIQQHGAYTHEEILAHCEATGNCKTSSGSTDRGVFARQLAYTLTRLSAEDELGAPRHNKIFHSKAVLVCRGGYYLLREREFESWARRWLPGELALTHTLDRAGFNTAVLLRNDEFPEALRTPFPIAAGADFAADQQQTQLLELVWQHLSTYGASSTTSLQVQFSLHASNSAMPPFFCQLDLAARDALLESVLKTGVASGRLAARKYFCNAMAPELFEHYYFATWTGPESSVPELDWYLGQWELAHLLPSDRARGLTVARQLFCTAWVAGQSLDLDYTLPVLPANFFERRASCIAGAGEGLFAVTTVEMCSLLGPYTGVERPDLPVDAWLPYGIRRADGIEIDGAVEPMSLPAMVNHAPASLANVWNKQIGNEIYFCTMRRLEAGEEIYFDYGAEWLAAAAAAGLEVGLPQPASKQQQQPPRRVPADLEESISKRQRTDLPQSTDALVSDFLNMSWNNPLEDLDCFAPVPTGGDLFDLSFL